jgi:hypothetical protein
MAHTNGGYVRHEAVTAHKCAKSSEEISRIMAGLKTIIRIDGQVSNKFHGSLSCQILSDSV